MKKLNILVVDGGGSKGTMAIEQLVKFEETLDGRKLSDVFNLFSGTSTGGIIAVLLSAGISAKDIRDLYVKHGAKIFDKKFLRYGIFRSRYADEYFNEVIKQYVSKKLLNDCGMLIVPAYNATKMDKIIFKSMKQTHKQVPLFDVIRSTASAPTYFDPHTYDNSVLIDGGLVINNPSMVCFIEGLKRGYKEINILSVGAGIKEIPMTHRNLSKGILKNARALFDVCLSEQAQTTDYMMGQLYEVLPLLFGINMGKYMRVDCLLIKSTASIDDFSAENVKNMLEDANSSFQYNKRKFEDFKGVLN